MTRIAHLTIHHGPDDVRIFSKEATALAAAGYDVTYFANCTDSVERNGVKIEPLGSADSLTDRWKLIPKATQLGLSVEADIYHVHDLELLPTAVFLSKVTSGAVVYDAHENYQDVIKSRDWVPKSLKPLLTRGIPIIENKCANNIDTVISATPMVGQALADYGVDNPTIIHNYPSTSQLDDYNSTVETDHEYTLIYVGGISKVRGLERMLRLLNELVDQSIDVGLRLVGEYGQETDRQWAQRFISEHELSSRVNHTGYVNYSDLLNYLVPGDIGLALYDVEYANSIVPTKCFEYMYAKLPVVVTDIHANKEYLPAGCKRIVSEHDAEAQATVVKELIEDRAKREEMGSIGREAVNREYSWNVEAKRLVNLYNNLS